MSQGCLCRSWLRIFEHPRTVAGGLKIHIRKYSAIASAEHFINNSDYNGGVRINKCFPQLSRRAVDEYICAGRVMVNGEPASLGQRLQSSDVLKLDGKEVRWMEHHLKAASQDHSQRIYIKCWKPVGIECTSSPEVEENIISHFGFNTLPQRVFAVGRLDKDSSGVILVTSDGNMTNRLLGREENGVEKRYMVKTGAAISFGALESIRNGVKIKLLKRANGVTKQNKLFLYKTLPCKAKIVSEDHRTLDITLIEGKNRQLRKMFEEIGNPIVALHRIAFGGIDLCGLKEGTWEYLTYLEIERLKKL